MSEAQHRVIFTPVGIRAQADEGDTVLDVARAAGVDIDSVCGGRGLCGRCQVAPSVGEFAKWNINSTAGALSDPGPTEIGYKGRRPLADGHRLGCQAVVLADVVIDVPAESQVHRQVVRKAIDLGPIEVDPVITLHYLELRELELGDESTDAALIQTALADEWGLPDVLVPINLLPQLHATITAGEQAITAVVHDRSRVVATRPGYSDEAYGMAVDVGSTTVAGYLLELATGDLVATAGRMNPQIRFGEDLMSRVSYVMMNPGGEVELTSVVRTAIDELIGELCEQAGAARDHIHDLVVVGNPIMHHLVLGIDPTPLGAAPFTLADQRRRQRSRQRHRCEPSRRDLVRRTLHRRPCGSRRRRGHPC